MSILNNEGIVFHDKAGGGWYCNGCKQYIHPDMIHIHKHTLVSDLAKSSSDRPLKPLKSAPSKPQSKSQQDELDEILNKYGADWQKSGFFAALLAWRDEGKNSRTIEPQIRLTPKNIAGIHTLDYDKCEEAIEKLKNLQWDNEFYIDIIKGAE